MTTPRPQSTTGNPRDDLNEARAALRSLLAETSDLAGYLDQRLANIPEPLTEQDGRLRFISNRLANSVIRPLGEALAQIDGSDTSPPALDPPSTGSDGRQVDLVAQLWRLAKDVTQVRMLPGMPSQVQEAAAALQDLVCRVSPADGPDGGGARLAELAAIQAGLPPAIQASFNGPYLVTNVATVTNWLGEPIPVRPQMALCRCGASAMKPWCDGAHARIGFTAAKDPERVPNRRDTYVGQQVTILDNRGTCQHSGYCTDRLATAFHLGEEPFVTPSGGRMDEIIRAVRDCPAGALSYAIDGREAREQVDFDKKREQTIEVSKDGPYRITGGIALSDDKGNDEHRNHGASREHYALCRCGHSQNKPFCSGMHWYVDFHDPEPAPEPTVFEWCGGLPALTRMTRLFYEKYVPQDPLLAPLFANMSADHPQRVAKWLGEVFCGPTCYSQEYGGYSRMISQHVGKGLTEEKRARWVALLLQSAREAGLPNDPEWRSMFASYIEWGSRLAVENSQTNARPPENMPMPHWDWHTAAGPPGSRISALAPAAQDDEEPVVLPAADEPVRFEKHVKQMFRQRDRQSMKFAFDLWAHADVKEHADEIMKRLHNGSMPCDGAWPKEKVDVFQRWVDSGMSG
ncbi:MAG: CDGSH iron-sulfur domain-containing protein [Chloroflexota bacterium]|nr:CDGSH iron-sulfur domain-containing protein [Chloroflexota bacterium]